MFTHATEQILTQSSQYRFPSKSLCQVVIKVCRVRVCGHTLDRATACALTHSTLTSLLTYRGMGSSKYCGSWRVGKTESKLSHGTTYSTHAHIYLFHCYENTSSSIWSYTQIGSAACGNNVPKSLFPPEVANIYPPTTGIPTPSPVATKCHPLAVKHHVLMQRLK